MSGQPRSLVRPKLTITTQLSSLAQNDKQLSFNTDRDMLILIKIPSTGVSGTYVGHFSFQSTLMAEAEWKAKYHIYWEENVGFEYS